MNKLFAVAAAAALLLCTVGCNSLETVDIDSETQAYSRVLYDDDTLVPEENEGEDYYYEYEEDGAPREEAPGDETEKKSEEKPGENKGGEKPAANSSKVSSAASSKKSVKISTYGISGRRSTSSGSRTASSASSKTASAPGKTSSEQSGIHSDTDTSSSSGSESSRPVKKSTKGSFTVDDLSYTVGREYLDLGDSEERVRKLLGKPNNEQDEDQTDSDDTDTEQLSDVTDTDAQPQDKPGEPEPEQQELLPIKGLIYDDVIVTLRLDEETSSYSVSNILIPTDSYYETRKGVFTDSAVGRVIEAYGEPSLITLPDGTIFSPENETESSESAADTESAEDTDTEKTNEHPDGTYSYIIGNRSFSLVIENSIVSQMIFQYEQTE